MGKLFKYVGVALLLLYLAVCGYVYATQYAQLFPAKHAQAVPTDWQPSLSKQDSQALIDGTCGKLHVVLWPTENATNALMLFHGNGESIASVEDYAPWIQARGYHVMAWDFAGYGKSTACTFGNEAQMLADSELAYQWLAAQVPANSITIFGRSIGAGLAVHVASQHTVKKLILITPYDSLESIAADHMPLIPIHLLMRYPLRAVDWINQVTSPIYAVHGTADTLIYPKHPQTLAGANPKVQLKWLQGATHNVPDHPDYAPWLAQILSQ